MDPAHNLNGVSQTTHMCVSLVIVNGPIARALNFNSRDGVFGNGYRANAAVGRAVRLALWNLGGADAVGHRQGDAVASGGVRLLHRGGGGGQSVGAAPRGPRLPARLGRRHRLCLRGTP